MTPIITMIVTLSVCASAMAVIGLCGAKHTKRIDDFLPGGRNMRFRISAFAYGTSYFSFIFFTGSVGNQKNLKKSFSRLAT